MPGQPVVHVTTFDGPRPSTVIDTCTSNGNWSPLKVVEVGACGGRVSVAHGATTETTISLATGRRVAGVLITDNVDGLVYADGELLESPDGRLPGVSTYVFTDAVGTSYCYDRVLADLPADPGTYGAAGVEGPVGGPTGNTLNTPNNELFYIPIGLGVHTGPTGGKPGATSATPWVPMVGMGSALSSLRDGTGTNSDAGSDGCPCGCGAVNLPMVAIATNDASTALATDFNGSPWDIPGGICFCPGYEGPSLPQVIGAGSVTADPVQDAVDNPSSIADELLGGFAKQQRVELHHARMRSQGVFAHPGHQPFVRVRVASAPGPLPRGYGDPSPIINGPAPLVGIGADGSDHEGDYADIDLIGLPGGYTPTDTELTDAYMRGLRERYKERYAAHPPAPPVPDNRTIDEILASNRLKMREHARVRDQERAARIAEARAKGLVTLDDLGQEPAPKTAGDGGNGKPPKRPSSPPGGDEEHHVFPSFLGGEDGPTVSLPGYMHGELHDDFMRFLRTKHPGMHPTAGCPGQKIRTQYSKHERLKVTAEFYKEHADKYPKAYRAFREAYPHYFD